MTTTMLSSLNLALHQAMEEEASILVLGEDVFDPYGGAFKVTKGLSDRFPNQVFSTPISEGAIVAIGTGLALRGFRPVLEIMFGDFLFLAADQLVNHAAKYRWMFDEKVKVPLVLRTPMGGGRGYGPTHSQTLEKHFLGIPGLWVVAPNLVGNPGDVLRMAIDLDDPVLMIENKVAYSSPLIRELSEWSMVEVVDDVAPFPTLWLQPEGECGGLLLCYGGMVTAALEAVRHLKKVEGLSLGLVIPTQLSPTPVSHLEYIVEKAGVQVFVSVEEATVGAGWGAEINATLEDIRTRVGYAPFTHRRVGAADHPIPGARDQEEACLPSGADIVAATLDCF